jgi:hypothetical protein
VVTAVGREVSLGMRASGGGIMVKVGPATIAIKQTGYPLETAVASGD